MSLASTSFAPPFYLPNTAPAGPHSHLVCGGCQTLLMFPQGAPNVRCSRCGHITAAPPTAPNPDTAQLVCNGCRVLLSYPRGAQSVQCSLCHIITQVPVYGHLACGGCSTMLMFPSGAQSVKCSLCHHVTPASQASSWPSGQGAGQAAQQRPKPPTQTVVVENPASLDDRGNPVANIAVGVRSDTQ